VKAAELSGFGFALVVGWTDPEGSRPYLGALLLAYYDLAGKLIYAGRVGTGIDTAELMRLWRRLQPLAVAGCRSMCRRRAAPASARPSYSAASIGCSPSSLRRSSFSPGRRTTCCARWSMKPCARTSPRERWSRLRFVVNALRRLFAEEAFVTLLRAEAMESLPRTLAEQLGMLEAVDA
jgi:hypothetical protein